ncbi:MAG: VRR-NUC domain-containing protein [Marinobacter sp.]|nr:VRR-NUC domain-containing protein [Marinobacter sp.]
MMTDKPVSHIAPASLDNPLYYLENMDTLVAWVARHHGDLLTEEENSQLSAFSVLSTSARALLTRMVMRSGDLFREDKLRYPELPASEAEALDELLLGEWIDDEPLLSVDDLFRLFTLAELRPALADRLAESGLSGKANKSQMRDTLAGSDPEPVPARQWLSSGTPVVVRLLSMPLFDRIRLMFFGNLRQSWTDFVLVELGIQQFEPVPFTPESRAFHQRADVDCYLLMHQCRERLDNGEPAAGVWQSVPEPVDNPWLASRRDRLLLELGKQAERQGDKELAVRALADSHHREARLKQLRLLERMKRFDQAWDIACQWQTRELSDSEAQGLARLLKRLAPKVGEPRPAPEPAPEVREFTVTLPQPAVGSVELAALQHLTTEGAPVFYVENTLINTLFGLLCWPVIFKPIPGAFFHPFHTGPADLTREDFVRRREEDFDQCFALLEMAAIGREFLKPSGKNRASPIPS